MLSWVSHAEPTCVARSNTCDLASVDPVNNERRSKLNMNKIIFGISKASAISSQTDINRADEEKMERPTLKVT